VNEKSNEKYKYHDTSNNIDYNEFWYKYKHSDNSGWVYGAFLGNLEDYKKAFIKKVFKDKIYIHDNYKYLLDDNNLKIDFIWYFPGGDMKKSELIFFNNGLLACYSQIFSPVKENSYFKYQFNTEESEITIQYIDKRVEFNKYHTTDLNKPNFISVNIKNQSMTYKIENNNSSPSMKSLSFQGWNFFEKELN
jgi:hypothetical protein